MASKSLGLLTLDMVLKTGSYTAPLDQATRQTKQKMKEIEQSASDAGALVARSFAALGIGLSLNEIRKYSDTWTDLNSRVRLAVGPMGDANKVMGDIEQIARRTYSSLEGTAEGYLLNASALTELGFSTQEQLQFTNALAAGLVASGAKAERAASVTNALSKAIAEGVLRGDNWNTVFQTGGEVADALARGLGVSRQELDKMARSGQLTAEKVVPALIGQMDQLQKKADEMGTTIGDALGQLDNSALKVFGSMIEPIRGAMATSIMGLANNLQSLVDAGVVLAAVYVGKVVSSQALSAAAFIENAKATSANATAQLLAADAATRRAFVEKQAALTTLNAARSNLTKAATEEAVKLATEQVTAAKARAIVAVEAYNKTAARSAAINNTVATSAARARAALNLIGGPAGLLLSAGLAFAYFSSTGRGANDSAEKLTQTLQDMKTPLDEAAAKFRKLTEDQKESLLIKRAAAQAMALQKVRRAFNELESSTNKGLAFTSFDSAYTAGLGVESGLTNKLKEAFEAGEQLTPVLREIGAKAGVPEKTINQWIELAAKLQDAKTEADNAANALKNIIAAGNGAAAAANGGATKLSPEFEKQAAALTKQIELFGKTGEAAKLLYEIQSGSLAGKLSETEQKALLELAQTLDLLNKNADAAKKLTDEQNKAAESVAAFIQNAREAQLSLQDQANGTDRLGRARQDLIKFERQLAEIKDKKTLTAFEKEFLAQSAATRAQLEKNVALEEEVRIRNGMAGLFADLQTDEEKRFQLFQERIKILEDAKKLTGTVDVEMTQRVTGDLFEKSPMSARLDVSVSGPSGELDRIADEEQQLNEWYQKQTEMLNQARSAQLDANIDWNAQELALKEQHEQAMAQIESQKRTAQIAVMGDFFAHLASMQDSESKKARQIAKAAAIAQALVNTYQAATGAYAAMAPIPVVGPALGAAAAAAAIVAGMANVNAIRGQAHNGLDYIPREGTWILDKGERVLSPRQNEDLTRFLTAVDSGSGSAGTGGFNPATGKVELQFNFTGLQNEQLMEMLMENRGAIAGMVSSAFEDQGIRLA